MMFMNDEMSERSALLAMTWKMLEREVDDAMIEWARESTLDVSLDELKGACRRVTEHGTGEAAVLQALTCELFTARYVRSLGPEVTS